VPTATRSNPLFLAAPAVVVVALLVCGLMTGLARLGVAVPAHALSNAEWHGVLMIPVFFGTVISLERAVAFGRRWHYVAPAAAAVAGVVLVAGVPPMVCQLLLLAAAAVSVVGNTLILRRQRALFLWILTLATVNWGIGNLLWFVTDDPFASVPWWLAFLILTIAAERLELTRLRPARPAAQVLFCAVVLLMQAALVWTVRQPDPGMRLFAASLLLLALWLARYDIARHTVRQRALVRFIAVCLLAGYGWLAVSGLLGLFGALSPGAPLHDAALHSLTLGFVFSMILGHAPIVVPSVTRLRVKYHPLFYVPLTTLHGALAVRVAGGLTDAFRLRQAGGVAAAVALAIFAVVLLRGVWQGRRPTLRHE
jgi:hypothetical protein